MEPQPVEDRWLGRAVVVIIGLLSCATVGAVIWLAASGSPVASSGPVHDLAIALVACLITLATTRSRPNDAPKVYQDTQTGLQPHGGEQFGTTGTGPA